MIPHRIGRYDQSPDPFFLVRGDRAVNISEAALKSVIFIGIRKDGIFQPRATAFFLRYREDQHQFDHLVTAEHVVSGLLTKGHDIWLRANLKSGLAREIRLDDPSAFRFHPNNERQPTDVAVLPFSTTFTDEPSGEVVEIEFGFIGATGRPRIFADRRIYKKIHYARRGNCNCRTLP